MKISLSKVDLNKAIAQKDIIALFERLFPEAVTYYGMHGDTTQMCLSFPAITEDAPRIHMKLEVPDFYDTMETVIAVKLYFKMPNGRILVDPVNDKDLQGNDGYRQLLRHIADGDTTVIVFDLMKFDEQRFIERMALVRLMYNDFKLRWSK